MFPRSLCRKWHLIVWASICPTIIHTQSLLVQDMTTPKSCILYEHALLEAKKVADSHPDWIVMRCSGISMNPLFGPSSILLVNESNGLSVKEGMVVIYEDEEGDLVSHRIVKLTENRFLTQGLNNHLPDSRLITREDIIGVVFGVFYTKGLTRFENAGSEDLSIALGKSN